MRCGNVWGAALVLAVCAVGAPSQPMSPEMRAKVEAQARQLQSWSTDAQMVAAVKAYNAHPPAEARAMTGEKWKRLTLLDAYVRSFGKSALGRYLKSKCDARITEAFVSGADGCKVAFLSKPTSWSHQGKPKHDVPMGGKIWYGSIEVDDSSGQQQVQVGLPVLDGGRPIGSIMAGLSVARLK